jgi:hypothetical protein
MRLLLKSFIAVVGLLLVNGSARADYQFTFANSSGVAETNFNVAVGQTVSIQVYLTQTGSTTTLSNGPGLTAGGVQLTGFNTAFTNVTGITANDSTTSSSTAFDADNTYTNIPNAKLVVAKDNSSVGLTNSAGSILLGTFTFTGISAGTTSTVTANPFPGENINLLAGSPPTSIDSLISNSSAVITVTAVPEPGTLVLTGLMAVGIAGGFVRRSRSKVEV